MENLKCNYCRGTGKIRGPKRGERKHIKCSWCDGEGRLKNGQMQKALYGCADLWASDRCPVQKDFDELVEKCRDLARRFHNGPSSADWAYNHCAEQLEELLPPEESTEETQKAVPLKKRLLS